MNYWFFMKKILFKNEKGKNDSTNEEVHYECQGRI